MSLGGYKFAGRYCQKGSLTDAQWALKMHKTKVAAFMAANSLSGAGWDYDMTGSPDGNYHCLDSVGNNYVTVFKRTNGENDFTWFALYTLTYFTTGTGTAGGSIIVSLINANNLIAGYYSCNFYKIGASQISYSDSLSVGAENTPNITGLMPMGNPGARSGAASTYFPTSGTSFKDESTVFFGFAVKADSIVTFQGNAASSGYISCSIASGHGFSSFVNSDDTCGVFAYNTQIERAKSGNYENAVRDISSSNMDSKLCASVKGGTGQVAGHFCRLGAVPLSFYDSSVENYPFQAISVFELVNSTTHIGGKGTLHIDLLSVNFPGMNQGLVPNVYSTFANGKYLCVNNITGSSYLGSTALNSDLSVTYNAAMYVGWDPSNPDITQASSWTEYTE